MDTRINIENTEIFFERELSWMDFNMRVIEEATNKSNPILERLKFLCISESNLDEFYMVRVAGVRELAQTNLGGRSLSGLTTMEILKKISEKAKKQFALQSKILYEEILPEMEASNIHLIQNVSDLTKYEIRFVREYYKSEVSGILTPLAIDTSHPFPHILNKSLNLAITLSEKSAPNGKIHFAVVQVPSVLPRFIELPFDEAKRRFFPLERIIEMHLSDLFFGMEVKEIHAFKITRDSDISIREDITGDLITSVKKELRNRFWGDAVRLDISGNTPDFIRTEMKESLDLNDFEIMEMRGIVHLSDLMYFYSLSGTTNLKFPQIVPKYYFNKADATSIFYNIRKNDILFHHPYDSFQVVEDLLKYSSNDPKVLAIKMTLYRTSGDSPIIQSLKQAAENGKQVTVLVELKARFDEERNIMWAQRLEDSGVHVVYGVIGMKVHCKMLLIVRKESDKLRKYVHLSTGNYNSSTARYYTDISILSENEKITGEVATLFNVITSFSKMPRFDHLSVAPTYLRDDVVKYIMREAAHAREGKEAYIFMKMNSLVDPDVILALYEASCAGVKVDLVIRGICCLKPGVAGLSENITVRSIIGRFLEHSRLYYYFNQGEKNLFLTSADCMPRNFYKRIEVMFPILAEENKNRIFKISDIILSDNVKARYLDSNGEYTKTYPGDQIAIDSQLELENV